MTRVVLQVEVVGCPTVCRHCWAQGVPYEPMPLEMVNRVLDLAVDVAAAAGVELTSYPMHEVAAHPEAPEIAAAFAQRFGPEEFEPFATTGVPLAGRADWREFIPALAESTGASTFVFAFHGHGEGHDRLVGRAGAFAESCEAVRRVRELGYRAITNVLVTRDVLTNFDAFVARLGELGFGAADMAWVPATYYPIGRIGAHEAQRPTVDEVLPFAEQIAELTFYGADKWLALPDQTEAAWWGRAVGGQWPDQPAAGDRSGERWLVCRPDGALHAGAAGLYGERYGNLLDRDPGAILERAFTAAGPTISELYLGTAPAPAPAELAQQGGDSAGRGIHFQHFSVYNLWAHRAGYPASATRLPPPRRVREAGGREA